MYEPFNRPGGVDVPRARPAWMEPTIRLVRGHAIYRRPEPCPVCGRRTDLFLTGAPGAGEQVWAWLRPHPACVLRDLAGRSATREFRIDLGSSLTVQEGTISLGTIRAGSALWGRPERLRLALGGHRGGRFGAFGELPEIPPDLDPWCPGAYDVATRNALALAEGRGLIWSRTLDDREGPVLIVLTALLGGSASTLVVPEVLIKHEDLDPEGLPDLEGGTPKSPGRRWG